MRVFDRKKGCFTEEKQQGAKKLEFLYNTIPGRILLKLFFCRRIYSRLNGVYLSSRLSAKKIKPFIREYDIDLTDCEKSEFDSFNDFFTRKRKFNITALQEQLISPCEGRLTVYDIDDELSFKVKQGKYTLSEITGNKTDLTGYKGGLCLIYRLGVQDYHRYIYIDSGRLKKSYTLPGVLHTVRSISEKYRVYSINHRVVSVLETDNFGEMIQIEVGALQVGKINNHPDQAFSKFSEKGYFSYGGSTIIQLFKKNTVHIDKDILNINKTGTEVLLRPGEIIGEKFNA